MSVLSSLGAVIVVTALCVDMVRRTAAGAFKRNHVYGLRLASTLASDEAWDAGHRAAVPHMRVSGWFGVVMTVITVALILGFVVSGNDVPEALVAVPLGALCIQLVGMTWGTVAANKAAKKVQPGRR
ncbi:SdpI family protein [Corynebacterium kalidii]